MKERNDILSKGSNFIFINRLRDAIFSFIIAIPRWARKDFIWGLIIIPIVFVAFMYGLSEADIFGWHNRKVCKHAMEIIHPVLLAMTAGISIAGYLKTKNHAFSFLAVLSAFALFREICGQGTTIVFVIGIIGLIYYAYYHQDNISLLIDSKWLMSFLAMCFVCYILSQLLDRGVMKRIGWLILWDTSWKPPHSSNIEEGLEALGGFFLMMTSISMFFREKKEGKIVTHFL